MQVNLADFELLIIITIKTESSSISLVYMHKIIGW